MSGIVVGRHMGNVSVNVRGSLSSSASSCTQIVLGCLSCEEGVV